jgi:maltooligosyltrehalose trehalohydrolase
MDFRVWAPKATTVEIALDNTRIPMTPYSGDGWTVDVQEAGPGIDYALRLDSPGSEEVRQFVCDSALM